ncbi:MAG: Trp biosynthesis-associated membrane protein [Gulosibacter sp.]|uniref:Trp biosynthesis-associated membrane protein n=1 Tax=Gulosibacter sp. TaxID=2817531 RepID=UPI003F911875
MSGKQLKRLSLFGGLLFAGLAMLSLTQPWAVLSLSTSEFDQDFTHSGGDSGTAIMAFALATLAAVGALAIAGRVFRYVIAALTVVLGVGAAIAAGVAMSDPAAGFGAEIRQFSAITDEAGVREIIAQGQITTTFWSVVALIAGIGIAIIGALVLATAHRWPTTGRKYSRTRLSEDGTPTIIEENDRVSQWDALSEGDDPTESEDENQNHR